MVSRRNEEAPAIQPQENDSLSQNGDDMKIFIWNDTDPITYRYHDYGGLLIIAPDLIRARELWSKHVDNLDECDKFEDKSAADSDPNHVYFTDPDTEETVLVFPNSGCC